ncbi:hypothetical protein ACB092_05G279900 [Castanea dentata]
MAFNLILVWRFQESRALMCFDKGARDQDEIQYSIFNFLSFFGGGEGDACLDLLQLLSVNTNKIGRGELFLSFWAGPECGHIMEHFETRDS